MNWGLPGVQSSLFSGLNLTGVLRVRILGGFVFSLTPVAMAYFFCESPVVILNYFCSRFLLRSLDCIIALVSDLNPWIINLIKFKLINRV